MKVGIRTCFIAITTMLAWACCFTQVTAECITNKTYCLQPPDRGLTGLDVLDGLEASLSFGVRMQYLADDFSCSQSGSITNIKIWGSYQNDNYLKKIPPLFSLAIFENIPADNKIHYSRPGNLLWSWYGTAIEQRDGLVNEHFYDPYQNKILGPDHQVWQYDFNISENSSFVQESGKTYWLGVCRSADLLGDGVVNKKDLASLSCNNPWAFGWKTSSEDSFDHDNAVFTDLTLTFPSLGKVVPPTKAVWNKLQYPTGNCQQSKGIDLAFTIGKPVPEPSAIIMLAGLGVILALRYGKPAKTTEPFLRLAGSNTSNKSVLLLHRYSHLF